MEDLSKLNQTELLTLRMAVNQELETYNNRAKRKCYGLFIPYDGWNCYIMQEHAIEALKGMLDDNPEMVFDDDEFKISLKYLNEAQLEDCKDWWKVKNLDKLNPR